LRLWVWWEVKDEAMRRMSDVTQALERLGSFGLIAYMFIWGLPQFNTRLEKMTEAQLQVVTTLRAMEQRMDMLERNMRGK
jgi:hypothetical protein